MLPFCIVVAIVSKAAEVLAISYKYEGAKGR